MSCRACGSEDVILAREGPPASLALEELIGSSRRRAPVPPVAVCRDCGLGWQDPMPSNHEVRKAYWRLRDDRYLGETENRLRSAELALHELERHARPTQGPLLDVGCSVGLLLQVALAHGWDAWGVEPSGWLSDQARQRVGSRVYTAPFEEVDLEGRKFGAITLMDVLEHVHDPQAFLRHARDQLLPGGIVMLNVPRRDSLVARALGRRWPLLLPEHLYYFTLPSTRQLLERAELDLIRVRPHPVFFSAGYVLERLIQHGWPGATAAARLARLAGAQHARVPLFMGEMTVVARARG